MLDTAKTEIEAKNLLPKCKHPNCNCDAKLCATGIVNDVEITKEYNLKNFEIEILVAFLFYAIEIAKHKKISQYFNKNFTKEQRSNLIQKINRVQVVNPFHFDAAEVIDNECPKLFEKVMIQFIINCNSDVMSNITIV